jgi:hypothetical protein
VISVYTRRLWVMFLFIALTLIIGIGKLQHAMEILPVIGTVPVPGRCFAAKG